MTEYPCRCKMINQSPNKKHKEEKKCTCSHQTQNICKLQNCKECLAEFVNKPNCPYLLIKEKPKKTFYICKLTKEY
jgi:hypothetical protein